MAADSPPEASGARTAGGSSTSGGRIGGGQVAQAAPAPGAGQPAGMKVLCQAMPAKGTILRIVQEGAKCYRESVSLFKGSLEKREEVACTTPCK